MSPLLQGILHDQSGSITTLGRHGSDQTAAIIGAAVGASEVQIWKDADGIMTADSQLVPSARCVRILTFEEMAELSSFSETYFVHPAAVLPAWQAEVPLIMRNSALPEDSGTRIIAELQPGDTRHGYVTTITSKRGITMVVIRSSRMLGQHGFLAHVFGLFNKYGVSVDVIATSEVSISLTLDQGTQGDVAGLLSKLKEVAKIEVTDGLAMLMLIAAKSNSSAVLHGAFDVFEKLGVMVEMVSHGASNVNITFILPDRSLLPCVQSLHAHFFAK